MKHFTYVVFALLLIAACKKAELKAPVGAKPCTDTLQHDIVSVSGPTSALAGQDVTFNVSWKGLNSCDNFTGFKQDSVSNTISVKAFATHDSCSICDSSTGVYQTKNFSFKTAAAGTYFLKFFKADNNSSSAIVDTLVVK